MGPQLFDPNVGINMAMSQRSDNMNLLGAQAQADASRRSGAMGAFGSIAGAAIGLCWVAREVYGPTNPKWKQFREWMLNDSPSWFRKLYIKHGEKFAKFISDKPRIKAIIRKWMNTKIK
jgi:predicted phosphoadenosine phosphosulfate sulfurtransferase